MADVKISDLPPAAVVEDTTMLEVETVGDPTNASENVTVAQLREALKVIQQGFHQVGCWPARALTPRITAGMGSLSQSESDVNDVQDEYLTAPPSSNSFCQFGFRAPKSSDETQSITIEIEWSEAPGATAHDVEWGCLVQAQGDGDPIDGAWGAAQIVVDTGAADTRHFATITGLVPAGAWAEGDKLLFLVRRLGTSGSDTLDVDARLHEITVFMEINGADDS